MAINEEKLHAFMAKAVDDLGATYNAALVVIGEKLGLYPMPSYGREAN
jgi:hypothetical protein